MTKKKTPSEKAKSIIGRPRNDSLKNPIILDYLRYLISEGATDIEICAKIRIGRTTLHRFKKDNPDFWNTITDWKAQADASVEQSLYRRATGYTRKEKQVDKDGNTIGVKEIYYPPSDTACIFWLKNRNPSEWREKVEHNHSLEELPLSVNFINGPGPQPLPEKASQETADDAGNVVGNETTGNG